MVLALVNVATGPPLKKKKIVFTSDDGRCNMELVAGSGEIDKTWFREALLE